MPGPLADYASMPTEPTVTLNSPFLP